MEGRGFPVTMVTRRCHYNMLIYCWEVNLEQKYAKNGVEKVNLYLYAENGIEKVN